MEPLAGTPRRGVLAATVISVAVLPVLVLSNLDPPPSRLGVAAAGDASRVATISGDSSPSAAQLGAASVVVLDEVELATAQALAGAAVPRILGGAVVEPVPSSGLRTAATTDEDDEQVAPTTAVPRPSTTRAPATTAPPTTAAPTTTAPPTTAPPTTAPPTTAPPTTAAPTTAPPTTAPPTTAAPGLTIFGQPYLSSWPSIDMWDRLSLCESSGNWAIDTGNGYYGGIQFSLSSWRWVGGSGSPADASREEQIYRGNLLWEKQGWGAWPGCTRRFGWSSRQTSQ